MPCLVGLTKLRIQQRPTCIDDVTNMQYAMERNEHRMAVSRNRLHTISLSLFPIDATEPRDFSLNPSVIQLDTDINHNIMHHSESIGGIFSNGSNHRSVHPSIHL